MWRQKLIWVPFPGTKHRIFNSMQLLKSARTQTQLEDSKCRKRFAYSFKISVPKMYRHFHWTFRWWIYIGLQICFITKTWSGNRNILGQQIYMLFHTAYHTALNMYGVLSPPPPPPPLRGMRQTISRRACLEDKQINGWQNERNNIWYSGAGELTWLPRSILFHFVLSCCVVLLFHCILFCFALWCLFLVCDYV